MVLKCLNSGCCQDLLLMLGRLEGLCLPFESTKSQQVGLSGLIGRAVSKFSVSLTIHHQKGCSELSCTFGFASRLSASDFEGLWHMVSTYQSSKQLSYKHTGAPFRASMSRAEHEVQDCRHTHLERDLHTSGRATKPTISQLAKNITVVPQQACSTICIALRGCKHVRVEAALHVCARRQCVLF